MPIDFPNSPALNDSFTSAGKTWKYNGTAWELAVGTTVLTDGSVTTAKIQDGAVTADKIEALAVTSGKIGSDAVTTGKIQNGAVTSAKLAAGAVADDLDTVLGSQIFG